MRNKTVLQGKLIKFQFNWMKTYKSEFIEKGNYLWENFRKN